MAKKTFQDYGREWLDTLVVAISVAMAFRAYFYEPFNIPTGSMQPTLYGNHTEVAPAEGKSVWDAPVLSFFKFMLTGETYKEFRAPWDGTLKFVPAGEGNVHLYVGSPLHEVKAGGLLRSLGNLFFENEWDNHTGFCRLPSDVTPGPDGCHGPVPLSADGLQYLPQGQLWKPVRKGELIWKGVVKKGDFIFVNRWRWNFFKPRRGEVMIFSTTGIAENPYGPYVYDGKRYNLAQGTHYIKRMMGMPGETLSIEDGKLIVNGTETAYEKPEGAYGEKPYPLCKVSPAQVSYADPEWKSGVWKLDDSSYFAAGDHSYPECMSADSRYWGPVPREKLRGCASVVFWPIVNRRWGNIK